MGGCEGAQWAMPPPNFAPNNFQDKSFCVSRIQENLILAGAVPCTPATELTAFPQTLWLMGRGLVALLSAVLASPIHIVACTTMSV